MARSARNRTTTQKSTKKATDVPAEPTVASEPTEVVAPLVPSASPAEATEDKATTLTTAYWFAVDERDEVTGTIPAAPLDAVKVAYRAVPKRDRGEIATQLGAEAATKMMRPDGTIDAGLAVAMGNMAALFAQVNAERTLRAVAAPHDPVPGVAGMLAALDMAREGILGNLTDEQRARVDQLDASTDATANAAAGSTIAALAKISARILNGRARTVRPASSGVRHDGPVRDLGALLRDAVSATTDPISLATIARDHGVSTGALDNRWVRETTDGVASVRDANGRKAFQAA